MKSFVISLMLLVATGLYITFLGTAQPEPLLKPIHEFPTQLDMFTQVGEDQTFGEEVMNLLGVDHYIMRQYRDKDGYQLGLYIGFYESQTEGQIIHSPKHCMPGSGWNTIESKEVPLVTTDSAYPQVTINEMVLQKGRDRQLATYWYHSRGRVVANEYQDRFYMIVDSLLKKRSDGALIRITGSGNNLTKDTVKQQQFAASVLKVVDGYLPE